MDFSELISELSERAFREHIPLIGQLELTSRCNLACNMCYVSTALDSTAAKEKEMSAARWIEIAEAARDQGMLVTNLTGGEPLVKEDFWAIYDGLNRLGIIFSLNTNGTTMTGDTVDRLSKAPPYRVLVSLYGGSPETYGAVTGNPNGYALAWAGIERLLAANITVMLRMTLTRDNFRDYPFVADRASELGLPLGIVNYISPRRDSAGHAVEQVRMNAGELLQCHNDILRYYQERNAKKESDDAPREQPRLENEPDEVAASRKRAPLKNGPFSCSAGAASFYVTAGGQLTPCVLMSEPGVSLVEHPFDVAWSLLADKMREMEDCQDCLTCPDREFCLTCPARRQIESGRHDQKGEYLCESARLYFQRVVGRH